MSLSSLYIVKLFENQGVYRTNSQIIGDVEIRPPKSDISGELKILEKSIEANKEKIDPKLNLRIGTIINVESLSDAEMLADEKFVEVLDILSAQFFMSNIKLSNSGYIKNLESGEITILKKSRLDPSMTFIRSQGKLETYEFTQWLANSQSELAMRYKRSLHWSRNGRWEKNVQIRILFNWFAIEALFKENASDNVGPIIRWFLGYPNGQYYSHVNSDLIIELNKNPLYDKWKSKIIQFLEEIRKFRNDSVHDGFRNVDYSIDKLRIYNQIMLLGCSRCQGAVVDALIAGLNTVEEFKEYIWVIFDNKIKLSEDVHGTILFSLEKEQNGIYIPESVYE